MTFSRVSGMAGYGESLALVLPASGFAPAASGAWFRELNQQKNESEMKMSVCKEGGGHRFDYPIS